MNNELILASKLPLDTLEDIFLACLSSLERDTKYELQHLLAWTHVCRHWRYTALNIHRLWTHIDIANTKFTREFIARSGDALVHLTSSSHAPKCSDELRLVATRIHSIDAALYLESLTSLFEIIGLDLPCLEKIELELRYNSWYFPYVSHAARLKKLSMESLSFPWKDYLGLSHLTRLSLSNNTTLHCPSFDQLFAIFEGAPRLEYLTLIHMNMIGPPPMRNTILPPNLREISLDAGVNIFIAVLQCLILPTHTRLHLGCCFPDIRDISPCRSIIQNKATRLQYVILSWHHIQFFESAYPPQDSQDPIMTITWPTRAGFLSHIHNFFNFSKITTFKLYHMSSSRDTLVDNFHNFRSIPNLRNLILPIDTLEMMLIILGHDGSDGTWYNLPPHTGLLCLQLQSICISIVGSVTFVLERYYASIIAIAKARCDAAIPLCTLEFEMCPELPAEFRDEVQGYVDRVIVKYLLSTL